MTTVKERILGRKFVLIHDAQCGGVQQGLQRNSAWTLQLKLTLVEGLHSVTLSQES